MIWVLLAIFLLLTVLKSEGRAERQYLRELRKRPCAGIRWVRRFPDASHAEIRAFLNRFAEAFVYRTSDACRFGPDDPLLTIYHDRFVHLTLDDYGEFESLEEMLNAGYSLSLPAVWHEKLSLGELFALTRSGGRPQPLMS